MAHKDTPSLPREFARRLMRRAQNHRRLVVTVEKGKPGRVFGFEEYLAKQKAAAETRPWEKRRGKAGPDPLGSVKGTVRGRLGRDEIYE